MNQNEYIAIIGDIHDSRLLENREDSQFRLLECLEDINKKFKTHIASNFSVSMGDSFQGLLESNSDFMEIITTIEMTMYPIEFRFGIGIGEIMTEINPKNSQVNDGPAYHYARKALELIEKTEQQNATRKTSILLLDDNDESATVRLINAIFALNTAIRSKWSNRQHEIIKAYLENEENQYTTAEAIGIGQSSVSKTLKSTNFFAYKTSIDDVQRYVTARVEATKDV